jgi:hypothetical protein
MSSLPDSVAGDAFTAAISIPAGKRVHLRAEVDYERLHLAYRVEDVDNDWRWLPQQFDASILSDEATAPGCPSFTGALWAWLAGTWSALLTPPISIVSTTRRETIGQTHLQVRPELRPVSTDRKQVARQRRCEVMLLKEAFTA